MNRSITRALALSCFLACVFAPVTLAKEKPPQNWDGLERKKVKGLDNVYVRPNVQFTPYKSVMLDETQVEFSKNWEKSFDFSDRPNAAEMQKIRENVAKLMQERFTKELVDNGYTVVTSSAEDTLEVRTAIIDLFVNAPDLKSPGNTKSYTTSAGRMTLVLEARDGPTGQLLARAVDHEEDEHMGGYMMWTTGASNTADARRIIDTWAKQLRKSLDRLNGKDPK
ncbi:MAG TPA: DUF3313 family protein [Steroidobacteraceae bacterium]|nr:DUF3313 family protein [Steroidobacteraceae bacterium]